MKIVSFFTLLVLLFQINLYAQQKKFGDISDQELEMAVYKDDLTAKAVVLFDVGEASINENLEVNFTRHVRVKILTDEGLSLGDIEIPYRAENPEQKISSIKAESYYLDDKGKIKKSKLGRRDYFNEEVSDQWGKVKFTIPGLRKGAIFEYSYELKSVSPVDVPDWFFQKEIPVAWSEYKVRIPEWFNYMPFQRAYKNFTIQEQKAYEGTAFVSTNATTTERVLNPRKANSGRSSRKHRVRYLGTEYHYAMKDIPALTDEPFMKAKKDYLAQVQFQLVSYQFPGERVYSVLDSWSSLVNAFDIYEDFGRRLRSYSILKQKADEVTAGSGSDLEKMVRIYEHLNTIMKWDQNHRLYVHKNLDELYQEGTGNSSEINFVLIQMLREAGLEADPVIMSTRDNGEIIAIYPLANQFNHTLARVKINGKSYLLDAKDENRPYHILPANDLNGRGLVVKSGANPEWVGLTTESENKLLYLINIEITPEGNIVGKVQSKNDGYFSHIYRENLRGDDKKDQMLEEVFTETENISIDSVNILSTEKNGSFNYEAEFQYHFTEEEDMRYINPMMIEKVTDNPFTKAERNYPVDYDYTFNRSMVINYSISPEWSVEEIPQSKIYQLADNGGIYSRVIQALSDDLVSIRYNFTIVRTRFMPNEYEGLRLFYDALVSDHAERIVLKKND